MKKIYRGKKETSFIMEGVDEVVDIVKTTLGGRGKNVAIRGEDGSVQVINDGVTIANNLVLSDPNLDVGAALARQVANKTNEQAGDGTTTSVVLLQAYLKAINNLDLGKSKARELRATIEQVVEKYFKVLDNQAQKVTDEDIENIAFVSCLDKKMAKVIADVVKEIGRDGAIIVEPAQKTGISYELEKGLEISDGYASPYLITEAEGRRSVIEDVPVLIADKEIKDITEITPLIEELNQKGLRKLSIFARGIADDVLAFFVVNKVQGHFISTVTTTSDLKDVAVVTGGKVISDSNGYGFEMKYLGKAGKVVTKEHSTTVVDGKATEEQINNMVAILKDQLEKAESKGEKLELQERIAKITGGVAVIKILGSNEIETNEKTLKLEDAINAVRVAVEDGIVEGGGVALYRASDFISSDAQCTDSSSPIPETNSLEMFDLARNILREVAIAPVTNILENADLPAEKVILEIKNRAQGYNVITDKFEDFRKSGIVDPVSVTKAALRNAVSMGNTILTIEGAIVNGHSEGQSNEPR